MIFRKNPLTTLITLGTAALLCACGSTSSDDEEENTSSSSSSTISGKDVKGSDEMVDTRDGRIYKTVSIGKQVWMAENLKFRGATIEYTCPGDSTDNDCDKYGALYTWNSAMYNNTYTNTIERGICPAGWHIPNYNEFNTLKSSVQETCKNAGICLKSENNWPSKFKGTDEYGFGAIPTILDSDSKDPIANFWTSNYANGITIGDTYKSNNTDAVSYIIENNTSTEWRDFAHPQFSNKATMMYVRCIRGSAQKDSIADTEDDIMSSSSAAYYQSSAAQFKKSILEGAKRYRNKALDYDTIIDPRDSNEYLAINIIGKKWMAENLRYIYDNLDSPYNSGDSIKYYLYGVGYSSSDLDNDGENFCPTGWHIPSLSEWDLLFGNVAATDLLAQHTGWAMSSTNSTGFSIIANPLNASNPDKYFCASDNAYKEAIYIHDKNNYYGSSTIKHDIISYSDSYNTCHIRCIKD